MSVEEVLLLVKDEVLDVSYEDDVSTTLNEAQGVLANQGTSKSMEHPDGITLNETTYNSLRSPRTSYDQFCIMLKFMERHGELSRQGIDRMEAELKWNELTNKLNEHEGKKSCERWRRVWADWKTKTRKKAFTMVTDPGSKVVLSSLEKRLLAFHGQKLRPKKRNHQHLESQISASPMGPVVMEDNENCFEITTYCVKEEGLIGDPLSSESLSASPETPSNLLTSPKQVGETPTDRPASPTNQPPSPIFIQTSPPDRSPPPVSPTPSYRPDSPQSPSPTYKQPAPQPPSVPTKPVPAAPKTHRQLPHSTTHRRWRQCCQQSNHFIALEHRRLRLEELRVRNQHERERERERNLHERETERLKLDARRLELEARTLELHAEQNAVMRRMNAWLDGRPK